MNVRQFAKIIFAFVMMNFGMAGPFTTSAAEKGSFEIRQVADEKESAGGETLPFAHARPGGETSLRVLKKAVLDQSDVASATAQKDPLTGDHGVLVKLTEKGTQRFAALTERSVNKRLAMVADGKVLVAPVIREKIAGGSLVVSGNFSEQEASDLAAKFNAGK